jgi:nucleoside-diphosphate-sugar epimerase
MNILITGCAGFIGSNLFNTYKSSPDVWGCDNLQFGYPENVEYNNWSRCGFETLSTDFINQYDVLVHLATANIIYCQTEPVDTFSTNAVKTIEEIPD